VTRAVLAIVILALALGVWVRTNGAERRWVWRDEATTLLHVMGRAEPQLDVPPARTFGDLAADLRAPAPGGIGAVVDALAREDSQHPPVYYAAQRLWYDAGGGALGRRSLSIAFGMLGVVAVGWFAFVLVGARAGAFALAFAAVSPFLVLYGQQLREYGLWCALIACSSGMLVVATRRGTLASWAGYALASAVALWTCPLSVLLAPAHVAFAAYAGGRRRALQALIAYAAAVASFAPWLAIVVAHRKQILESNAWSATPYALPALAAKVLFTAGSAFTDLGYASRWGIVAGGIVLLAIAVAALVVARRDRPAAVLLGLIAVTTALLPFLADLALGEHRTASSRYLCPLVVAIIVCMATALARWPRPYALGAAVALVALGAFSSLAGTSSPVWWDNHGDASVIAIAAALARDPNVPVVADGTCAGLLTLARIAPPGEPVRCGPGATKRLEPGWYVVSPTPALAARARSSGLDLASVAGGADDAASVRAFRRNASLAEDAPTLDKLESIPHR
jgi:hypothetical protein